MSMRDDEALRLQQQIRRLIRRQRSERPRIDGLVGRAVQVLGVVGRAVGPVQPGAIADELAMATSNVATSLRELEAIGFIARERSTDDARRVDVEITAAGEAAVTSHRASRAEWLREAADATLTEVEQQQLIAAGALLDRMATWRGAHD